MNTQTRNQNAPAASHPGIETGRLLGVWAHPDDDAYLSAGLMAAARAAGHRVVVATATKGELGTDDPARFPPQRLASIREQEAANSLAMLGVREHRWLGHRDGTLDKVAAEFGISQLSELIKQVRPDTIVTFGPEGMTGHPDHIAISQWVTEAWDRTGRHSRLWYATLTPEFHQEWAAVNSEVGLWFEGTTPPCDPASELAFAMRCDGVLLERKVAALVAHASQTAGLINHVGLDRYRRWWSTEFFVDASRASSLTPCEGASR